MNFHAGRRTCRAHTGVIAAALVPMATACADDGPKERVAPDAGGASSTSAARESGEQEGRYMLVDDPQWIAAGGTVLDCRSVPV